MKPLLVALLSGYTDCWFFQHLLKRQGKWDLWTMVVLAFYACTGGACVTAAMKVEERNKVLKIALCYLISLTYSYLLYGFVDSFAQFQKTFSDWVATVFALNALYFLALLWQEVRPSRQLELVLDLTGLLWLALSFIAVLIALQRFPHRLFGAWWIPLGAHLIGSLFTGSLLFYFTPPASSKASAVALLMVTLTMILYAVESRLQASFTPDWIGWLSALVYPLSTGWQWLKSRSGAPTR